MSNSDGEIVASSRKLRDRNPVNYKEVNENANEKELGKEDMLAEEEDRVDEKSESSVDEEEINALEQKLNDLKVVEKKRNLKEKHRRISLDLENAVKRIEGKKSLKKSASKVTTASLRNMSDVVSKVDKMMDVKLKRSVEISASESSDDGGLFSGSDEESRPKVHSKQHHDGNSRSGSKFHRSGKSKKVTSYVRYPQLWPHSYLSLQFVSKGKEYEDLSIPEFCAGYAAILEESELEEVKCRVAHFKDLMYSATQYEWKNVLDFHAACLCEIERGHMKWGDSNSFQRLENRVLAGAFLQSSSRKGRSFQSQQGLTQNNREDGPILFCRFYQRGTCFHNQDHMGKVNGEEKFVRHICARCWLKDRKRESHPESFAECPSLQG